MKLKTCIIRSMVSAALMSIPYLTVFVFPLSSLHAADPVGWEDLGLYGGQINDIAIDPVNPNIMFAGSWYGDGLFKSNNAGATWESVEGFGNELVKYITFDPQNHRTIWVAAIGYIYKSEDGGLNWELKLQWSQHNWYRYFFSLAIDPLNSNIIYVGTSGRGGSNDNARIYKTTDGGATWQETSLRADHNVVDLAINLQNPQEIWAITGPKVVSRGSIYRSLDGGSSWSKINTGLYPGWFEVIAINSRDPRIVYVGGENGLYRTENGGGSWSQLEPDDTCRGLALDPQNPEIVYARWLDWSDSVISKSTDGGDSWVTHSIDPLQFTCLKVHPSNTQVLFGGDVRLGVYKSTDEGENWQATNQGIRANHVFDSTIPPSGKLLVGSVAGVYLKSQGGSWEQINPYIAYAVEFSPEDENTIYAGFDYEFGKSTDSGQTWSSVDISYSSTPHEVKSIAFNAQNPATLYLGVYYSSGTKGEIYKSTDGGESIILIASADKPVNIVLVNPNNPRVIYAGTGMYYAPIAPGAIFKSIDGGETWEAKVTGVTVNTLVFDPENPEIVYAGCGASGGYFLGLLKSIDGGETWEEKRFGIPDSAEIVDLGIDPDNTSILYAATAEDGIYVSHDAGNYWTLQGLSEYWLLDILVTPSSPSTSKTRRTRAKASTASSDIYAGSGSGMLEFTGSGLGIMTGMVTDAITGLGITEVSLSTDTGGVALSLSGHYVMNCPTGLCSVSASINGYQSSTKSGMAILSGEETTVNFSLEPLPEPDCPAEVVLDNAESPISILRKFRDNVLNKELSNLRLSELYYKHSVELVSILLADGELREETGVVLMEFIPEIQSFTKGGSITLTSTQMDNLKALMDKVASNASTELRAVIEEIKEDMLNGKFFDLLEEQ